MKYIEGFNRSQTRLFPQCIDEIIPEDSEVLIIDAFVDALPLEELGFMNHKPLEEGRPMYHPRDMFKLYIYGYLNRIRTSRLLERECERNVELMRLALDVVGHWSQLFPSRQSPNLQVLR